MKFAICIPLLLLLVTGTLPAQDYPAQYLFAGYKSPGGANPVFARLADPVIATIPGSNHEAYVYERENYKLYRLNYRDSQLAEIPPHLPPRAVFSKIDCRGQELSALPARYQWGPCALRPAEWPPRVRRRLLGFRVGHSPSKGRDGTESVDRSRNRAIGVFDAGALDQAAGLIAGSWRGRRSGFVETMALTRDSVDEVTWNQAG